MKAQSKNRKSPTCSRCRFHGERDVRVLQHKCPYKDCCCSDCQLVKSNHLNSRKRSIVYKAQKNLEKQDENSNGAVSSPGSGSTGSSRCHGSPHSMTIPNVDQSESNSLQTSPWASNNITNPSSNNNGCTSNLTASQAKSNAEYMNKAGYSSIKNFQTLCLTFPDHSPPQLQALFEQCGNDFEKTVDKILMNKWYSDPQSDYQLSSEPAYPTDYTTTSANNHNSGCDDHSQRSANQPPPHSALPQPMASSGPQSYNMNFNYGNQANSRMMHAPVYNNNQELRQDYASEDMAHRSQQMVCSPNAMFPNAEWMYSEIPQPHSSLPQPPNRYSPVYQNAWASGEYSNYYSNNSNFWNNGHSYSYPNHNESTGNMNYIYGRNNFDYQESGHHVNRGQQSEIGSNISSSNFDFDSY